MYSTLPVKLEVRDCSDSSVFSERVVERSRSFGRNHWLRAKNPHGTERVAKNEGLCHI